MADLYYIDSGYLTPDSGYYNYIAEAEAAPVSNFTISCDATRIGAPILVEADASLFNTATVSAIPSVGKETQVSLTSPATLDIIATRIQEASAAFTSAFAPSLSVEVFKNSFAVLDVPTVLSAVSEVNRSITQALDTIASLNAMAVKTVDITSAITIIPSITATATKLVLSSSSSLESTSSLTVNGGKLKLADSTQSAKFNLFASRLVGTRRPVTFNPTFASGGKYITQGEGVSGDALGGQVKYGTHSLYRGRLTSSTLNSFGQQSTNTDFRIKANDQFSIEFWIRFNQQANGYSYTTGGFPFITHTGGTYANQVNGFNALSGTSSGGWGLGFGYESSSGGRWRFRYRNNSATFTTIDGPTNQNLPIDVWIHIAVARGADGVIRLYKDGSQIASQTYSGLIDYYQGIGGTDPNPIKVDSSYILGGTTGGGAYLDEFSFQIGSNQLLGLTSAIGNTDYHQALLHINGNGLDDTKTLFLGAASLASTFSVSAQPNEIQNLAAALTATSTQTTIVNITSPAVGNLTSAVLVIATATRVQEGSSNLDTACTLLATATKIPSTATSNIESTASLAASLSITRAAFGDLSSLATQSLDYTRTRETQSNLVSAFAPTLSADAQRAGVALLESVSSLSVEIAKITSVGGDLNTSTTVEVNAGRLIATDSQLASESTLAIDYLHLVGQSAAALSEFSLSSEASRTRATASTQSSTVTALVEAARTRDTASSLTSSATVSATALRIQPGSAELTSTATSTSTAVKTTDSLVAMAAEATQTVLAVKTTNVSTNFTAIATELTAAFKNATGTISMESSATLSMLIGKRTELLPNQNRGIRSSGLDSSSPRLGPLTGLPSGGLKWNDPGFTASVWARRKTTNTFDVLWTYSNRPPADQALYALVIDNNNVRIRNEFDADEPGATWNNQAPVDTEWHHYLLQCSRQYGYWQLWIDGVYKGEQYHGATFSADFNNNQYIQFGGGLNRSPGVQYDEAETSGNLDFAQIWVGGVPSIPLFNPTEFYNSGYVELGDNGRGEFNRLPAPYIYNRLNGAYTYQYGPIGVPSTYSVLAAESALRIPTAPAQFNLVFDGSIVLVLGANLASTSTLIATGNYRVDPTADLDTTVTLLTATARTRTVASALSTEFTQSAAAFKARTVAADLASTVSLSAIIGYVKLLSAVLNTEFTLTCEPTEIVAIQASASLSSEFTVTANVNERQGFTITPSSEFTVTCDATVKPPVRITSDLTAAFTVTAELTRVQEFSLALTSQFTQTTLTLKIKGVVTNLTSTSTLTVLAGLRLQGAAALQVQAFELTQGDILNFAPELTLYVPQETRLRRVLPENRLYAIDSESRTRRVLPESRIITIEQQTEVNII